MKEEFNYKKSLKINITSFLSYTILLGFIYLIMVLIVKYALKDIHNNILSITLSLISCIIIYFILHFACKSSNYETFKHYKITENEKTKFLKKMNLLFLICTLISIFLCISYLLFDFYLFSSAIEKVSQNYSPTLAESIISQIKLTYQTSIFSKVTSNILIEFSLFISFISLIPYQKNLLKNEQI